MPKTSSLLSLGNVMLAVFVSSTLAVSVLLLSS